MHLRDHCYWIQQRPFSHVLKLCHLMSTPPEMQRERRSSVRITSTRAHNITRVASPRDGRRNHTVTAVTGRTWLTMFLPYLLLALCIPASVCERNQSAPATMEKTSSRIASMKTSTHNQPVTTCPGQLIGSDSKAQTSPLKTFGFDLSKTLATALPRAMHSSTEAEIKITKSTSIHASSNPWSSDKFAGRKLRNQGEFPTIGKNPSKPVPSKTSTDNQATPTRPEKIARRISNTQISPSLIDLSETVSTAVPRIMHSSTLKIANSISIHASSNPWSSNESATLTLSSIHVSHTITTSHGANQNSTRSTFGNAHVERGFVTSSIKSEAPDNQKLTIGMKASEVTQAMSPSLMASQVGSNTSPTTKLICSELRSCKDRCRSDRDPGRPHPLPRCFCDPFCETFRDCCADYGDYCAHQNTSVTKGTTGLWQCIPLSESQSKNIDFPGIWMISACPRSWNRPVVRAKCQLSYKVPVADYREIIPVVSSTGTTFKNRYCAQCNGVVSQQLTDYTLHESCFAGLNQSTTCASKTGSTRCQPLKWFPPNQIRRRYCSKLKECPQGNKGFQKCADGKVGIVTASRKSKVRFNYKNHFCAACDGAITRECGPVMFPSSHTAATYSSLFNPPAADSTGHDNDRCAEGEVYDALVRVCRQAVQLQTGTPYLTRYRVTWRMTRRNHSLGFSVPHEEDVKATLYSLFAVQPYHIAEVSVLNHDPHGCILAFEIDWTSYRQPNKIRSNLEMLANVTEPLLVQLGNRSYNVTRIAITLVECGRYEEFPSDEYTFIPSYHPVVFLNESREILYAHQYRMEKVVWENCLARPAGTVSVCRLYLTVNCSGTHLRLQRNEYTIFSNGTLYRNASRKTYDIDTYVTRNNTAWVCENDNRQSNVRASSSDVEVILTHVGLSLSIFCLIVTLFTYSLFAELRTLFGVNLINLCVSLLFQKSLYFLTGQTQNPVGCGIVAAMIHYFILTSFSWMSIIAFDAKRTICTYEAPLKGTAAIRSLRSRLRRRMALAWLLPLLVLVISVGLDLSGTFPVSYGDPDRCLITSTEANIVFLYTPIGLSIAFNASMFVVTSVFLRVKEKETTAVLHIARKRALPAIARLSVLMGFTWIFGFLGILVSELFFYPFTVLATLQGVYIVVAFVLRRRILRRYRKLVFPKKQMEHQVETRPPKVRNIAFVAKETMDTKL